MLDQWGDGEIGNTAAMDVTEMNLKDSASGLMLRVESGLLGMPSGLAYGRGMPISSVNPS